MHWKEKVPWEIVNKWSVKFEIDPLLICSIIKVESDCNTYAIRYEKDFRYRKEPYRFARLNNFSEDTENILQACSIGLMQVMGCVARELGHTRSLLELVEPEIGIEFGCKRLNKSFLKYDLLGDIIASYNAGSVLFESNGKYKNQGYVNKVLERMKELPK